MEFLLRDAKQLTGLTDAQARSHAKRNVPFNASLSAVTLARLDARQHNGNAASGCSMARLKRRACNQHLIERTFQYGAQGHSVETSSPEYEELRHYGTITEKAS
jgi:hypothetical protein